MLSNQPDQFWIFKDQFTNLEYIRRSVEIFENGFYVILKGYQSMALVNFREVIDNEWRQYSHLNDFLGGRGVPNIEEARVKLIYEPLLDSFRSIYNAALISKLNEAIMISDPSHLSEIITDTRDGYVEFYFQVATYTNDTLSVSEKNQLSHTSYGNTLKCLKSLNRIYTEKTKFPAEMGNLIPKTIDDFAIAYAWILLKDLGSNKEEMDYLIKNRARIDEWHLGHMLRDQLSPMSTNSDEEIDMSVNLIKILVRHQDKYQGNMSTNATTLLRSLLADPEIHDFLNLNRFQDVLWYNSDKFSRFVNLFGLITLISTGLKEIDENAFQSEVNNILEIVSCWREASVQSKYQVEKLLNSL